VIVRQIPWICWVDYVHLRCWRVDRYVVGVIARTVAAVVYVIRIVILVVVIVRVCRVFVDTDVS
jgi:hypothetical protein